jgi:DNA invertase Pin-like site-specific DNA recombinase
MTIHGYARVSTDGQTLDAQGPVAVGATIVILISISTQFFFFRL